MDYIARVWRMSPLLLGERATVAAWRGVDGDYERLLRELDRGRESIEVGGGTALVLEPEHDEGPVEVFRDGSGLLFVGIVYADDPDPKRCAEIGREDEGKRLGTLDLGTGELVLLAATVSLSDARLEEERVRPVEIDDMDPVEGALALTVTPGRYDCTWMYRESDHAGFLVWRMRPAEVAR